MADVDYRRMTDDYLNSTVPRYNPAADKSAQKIYDQQLRELKKQLKQKLLSEKEFNEQRIQLAQQLQKRLNQIQTNALKNMSLEQLKQAKETNIQILQLRMASMGEEDKEWRRQMSERLAAEKEYAKNLNEVIKASERGHVTSVQRKFIQLEKYVQHGNKLKELAKQEAAALEEAKYLGMTDEQKKEIKNSFEHQRKNYLEENNISESQVKGMQKASTTVSILNKVLATTEKIASTLSTKIDDAIQFTAENTGRTAARLQGIDESFSDYQNKVSAAIGGNAYISQKKVLENIVKFTDAGIIYNAEQRALIATLSDRMVTTFDAMDSTLTRLIRIQQADLTMSQLGAEATLTQFLNQKFGNTEYLGTSGGTGIYDSVYAALIDASAVMNRDQATSYAFNAQKWLGSMYSIGVSDAAIQSIAEGLGYIATGNVSALSSNSALQTLFAMSAKNAGLSYSSLLTSGATADDINKLLKSMTEYLQDISENTSNQVTRNAFSQLLNISMADLQAIRNLNSTDIADIYNTTTNYESSIAEALNQFSEVKNRTTLTEAINNVLDNVQWNIGMDIADDEKSLIGWQIQKVLTQVRDAIGIQGTISNWLTGIAAASSLFSIISSGLGSDGWLADIYNGGWVSNDAFLRNGGFSWDEVTTRGQLLTTKSSADGISMSAVFGKGKSYENQLDNDTSSTVVDNNYNVTIAKTSDDLYQELFVTQNAPIRVKLADIEMQALSELYVDDLHEIRQAFNEPISVVESGSGTLFEHEGDSAQDIIDTVQDVRNGRLDSNATNSTKSRVNNYSWANQF